MVNLRHEGVAIGVMAHPLLLGWNGTRWEAKRPVNNQSMKTLKAGIPQHSAAGMSIKPLALGV